MAAPVWLSSAAATPPGACVPDLALAFAGIIILGIADSAASAVGRRFGRRRILGTRKTLEGTLGGITLTLAAWVVVWPLCGCRGSGGAALWGSGGMGSAVKGGAGAAVAGTLSQVRPCLQDLKLVSHKSGLARTLTRSSGCNVTSKLPGTWPGADRFLGDPKVACIIKDFFGAEQNTVTWGDISCERVCTRHPLHARSPMKSLPPRTVQRAQ